MAKIGFWEGLLGDVGHFEREAINSNAEALSYLAEAQSSTDAHQQKQLSKLFALDKAQSQELARLRAMVHVLSELVCELGIDKRILEARMNDTLTALEEEALAKENAEKAKTPYRDPATGEVSTKTEPVTECASCRKKVLLRRTNISEIGNVCGLCLHNLQQNPDL